MARRAFLPTLLPPADGSRSLTPQAVGVVDVRGSMPPTSDGLATTLLAPLLDRLALADDLPTVLGWLESLPTSRSRQDPTLATRLLRAYREAGHVERARQLAQALPQSPSHYGPLEAARLWIERAWLSLGTERLDHAESEIRQAGYALSPLARGAVTREQVELQLVTASLELRRGRVEAAAQALKLAEHVEARCEEGPVRAVLLTLLGTMALRLPNPRAAARHLAGAVDRAPTTGMQALRARGNLAIALASVGAFDEARAHATAACQIAQRLAPGPRHADAFDVLGVVEIAADQPAAAVAAFEEGLAMLGEVLAPALRHELFRHRAVALAMAGRSPSAEQSLERAHELLGQLERREPADELEMGAARARVLEASGRLAEVVALARPLVGREEGSFAAGQLDLALARACLGLGDDEGAREGVERAAISGERHGWVFPDRAHSTPLWELALKSGDSRVVRYAEKVLGVLATGAYVPSLAPPSSTMTPPASVAPLRGSIPPAPPLPSLSAPSFAPPSFGASVPPPPSWSYPPPSARGSVLPDAPSSETLEGDPLLYVTTASGVTRARASDLEAALEGAALVVDTVRHTLRVHGKEISLERRRALEPLVVQLFRRAREGLSAEEILRAAGGPGPESADAEHRVRVLISRVRDLFGDVGTIERLRDAGERGRTRYRLAPGIAFALIEPLYAP